MTKAAQTASARLAETAPDAVAPDDGRPKLQALAAPVGARRANWRLRPLGARAFELASAQG